MDANPYQPPQTLAQSQLPTPFQPARWFTSMTVMGLFLGAVARSLRPYMYWDNAHWESVYAFVILCSITVILLWRVYRFPLKESIRLFVAISFLLWVAFAIGWSVIKLPETLMISAVCVAWWAISSMMASLILALPHRRTQCVASKNVS